MAKKEKESKRSEPIFNQDFLDKIVESNDNVIVNLCKTCHNVPICATAHSLMNTYDNLGIGQVTIQCPYYISPSEISFLNKEDPNGDSSDKSGRTKEKK